MKKFIIGFFSVLLFLIVGLAIFVFTFDLNNYKSRIEKALTDLSGYNFVINGKIKSTRSLEPIIVVSDVNIMASSGFAGQHLLHAKTATIRLDLKSLIKDTIVIHSFDLTDVNVDLKVDEKGNVNWLPIKKQSANASGRPSLKKTAPTAGTQKNVNIASVNAIKVNVQYEDKQNNSKFSFTLPKIAIQQLLNFSGEAVLNTEKIAFTGTIRNLPQVLKSQKNLNFSFDINSSLGSGKISGVCYDLTACRSNLTLNLDFSGKNFDKAHAFIIQNARPFSSAAFTMHSKTRLLKQSLLTEGVFSLTNGSFGLSYNIERDVKTQSGKGRIELDVSDSKLSRTYGIEPFSLKMNYTSDKGKIFDFSNITSMFNETDIDGTVRVDLTKQVPDITAQLHSHYFKLSNVLYSEEKTEQTGNTKNADKLFSTEAIDWNILKNFNGSVSILIDNLSVANMLSRYPQVLLNAKLSNGVLNIDLREGSFFAGGQIVGNAVVKTQQNDNASLELSAVAQGLAFSQVMPWKKVLRSGEVNANVFVKTDGKSFADLLGNLDGSVLLTLNQVDITSPVIEHLSSGTSQSGMSRTSQELFIKCGVINTTVKDGVFNLSKNVALETSKFNMVIDGTIDLKDEQLSLRLLPQANKADKISQTTQGVAFLGPFMNPQSSVIEQKIETTKKQATQPMSEKQAFLNSYTKKPTTDDSVNSVCRIAMGTAVLKDIDAYFGREKVVEQTQPEKPVEKKEEVSKMQLIGRDLLDSLSDALSNESKPTKAQ